MKPGRVVDTSLLVEIQAQFRLDWAGHHGFPHWARVYRHGLYVGRAIGADLRVVELFAFLHDSQRENEYTDPEHGARAAEYARWLHKKRRFELDRNALGLLTAACEGHSEGYLQADPTVMACWDADRLDLGRVGIRPDPRRLCTVAARQDEYLERAWRRGLAHANKLRANRRRAWYSDESEVVRLGEF